MFENATPSSLNSFTKPQLLAHLNREASSKEGGEWTNAGAALVVNSLQWNNTVHFDLTYTPWKHLGFKFAVACLSPQVALGIKPDYLLLDLTTSSKYSLDALEELATGFFTACKTYGCKSKINDITTAAVGLSIHGTAINTQLPTRSPYVNKRLNAGDLICVSGDLGGAYLGLMLLEREKRVFKDNPDMQPDLEGKDYIVGRQLKPNLRLDVVDQLVNDDIALSGAFAIDNGLSKGLMPIFENEQLGVVLYEEKLPIDHETLNQCIDFGIDPTVAVLDGGEDYELGYVIPQSEYEKVQKLNQYLTVIGYVADQTTDILMQLKSGKSVNIKELRFDNA